jgi:hypothetical protein
MLRETVIDTIKQTGVIGIVRGIASDSVMETVRALYMPGKSGQLK